MYKRKTKDAIQYPVIVQLASLKEKISPRNLAFAKSLVDNYNNYGKLSVKQFECVKQLIDRTLNPPVQPDIINISVAGINKMFDNASQKLKRVKVVLQDSTGQKVVLKKAGPTSKYVGQIMISDGGSFGNAAYYGRIDNKGNYMPTKLLTDSIKDLLIQFSTNPVKVASDYGKLVGACCFCSKPLNDERSTEVGYGPVCAGRFGLVWGK